ncbi:TIGR01440 family protein [Salimicrobium sp. PL1-032A]|uniref:TIGR01440 family protein n=1 Tax=Salimicrobium sp. PL1-032A TaxID=3095364 RepID=UPI0032614C8E
METGFMTGGTFVVGCSTSEVIGERIGTSGSDEVAEDLFAELRTFGEKTGMSLAFQCCEHLNRAVVVERETAERHHGRIVAAVPVREAGGSMAAYAYRHMNDPVLIETIEADAGIDIGDTLIGMHLKRVAVPLRIEQKSIGNARITAARTRPPLIGGPRAVYE